MAVGVVSFAESFAAGRQERARQRRSVVVPALAAAAKFAGRHLPTWRRVRSGVMQVTAFGFLDYAAWSWHHIAGYVAIGASLLILEVVGGER